MQKHTVPLFHLEKAAAPGEREIRMRPARTGNPLRAKGDNHGIE